MKKIVMLMLSFSVLFAGRAMAAERPFNLTLVNPVQIFNSEHDITGIRANLLYGRNENVKGIDFGFGLGHTTGSFKGLGIHEGGNFVNNDGAGIQIAYGVNRVRGNFSGLEMSAVNLVGGHASAVQLGFFNKVDSNLKGIQLGAINLAGGDASSLQLGVVNIVSGDFSGVQIGVVNIGGIEKGIQIGLVNVNKNRKPLPFFPIFNARF